MRNSIYVPTITFDSCGGTSVHVRELAQSLLEPGNGSVSGFIDLKTDWNR